jgi:hypothetical protein
MTRAHPAAYAAAACLSSFAGARAGFQFSQPFRANVCVLDPVVFTEQVFHFAITLQLYDS